MQAVCQLVLMTISPDIEPRPMFVCAGGCDSAGWLLCCSKGSDIDTYHSNIGSLPQILCHKQQLGEWLKTTITAVGPGPCCA